MNDLLSVVGLSKTFITRRGGRRVRVSAVRGISLAVRSGSTLAIVGESGSGKSTAGRLITRLIEPDEGTIAFAGADVRAARGRRLRALRARMPMVFQDPYSSLDPTWMIEDALCEAVDGRPRERASRALELLDLVRLPGNFAQRYPFELSGGQRQRVAIARALASNPAMIICDEAVAALDVSTKASIIRLLQDLQDDMGVGYIFISHDLALVRGISDEVAVMYLGRIVEQGPTDEVYQAPAHPYSALLIESTPEMDPDRSRRTVIPNVGEAPSASDLPQGCPFASRCPFVSDVCLLVDPPAVEVSPGRLVACHNPLTNSVRTSSQTTERITDDSL